MNPAPIPARLPKPRQPSAACQRPGPRLAAGLILALGFALWPLALCGQSLPPLGPPGRYLLLVETSEAMRPRTAATLRALESLLASGMHGQFRAGETLGVWTYNEDLHAGELPLQVWTPQTGALLTSNVLAFLKSQPCEKNVRLAAAWPDVEALARESPRLTVIWVNSGGEPIRGTPFDAQINEFLAANAPSQTANRMPLIIVLRAQQGDFCGVTLNLAPWPVLLPSFPPWIARPKLAADKPAAKTPEAKTAEVKPAEKIAPPPPATPATPAPSTPPARTNPTVRPPLIIVGKKDEPTSPPAPATETASARTEQPAPAEATKPEPTTVPKPVEPPQPTPAPEPAAKPLAPLPAPQAATLPAGPTQAPVAAAPESGPAPPAPVVETPESSAKVAAATPAPSSVASPAGSRESSASGPSARPASPPNPTVATATPGATAAARLWWLWIAGGICVLGAAAAWLFVRRSRAAHRASLITRSMEAQRRPPD